MRKRSYWGVGVFGCPIRSFSNIPYEATLYGLQFAGDLNNGAACFFEKPPSCPITWALSRTHKRDLLWQSWSRHQPTTVAGPPRCWESRIFPLLWDFLPKSFVRINKQSTKHKFPYASLCGLFAFVFQNCWENYQWCSLIIVFERKEKRESSIWCPVIEFDLREFLTFRSCLHKSHCLLNHRHNATLRLKPEQRISVAGKGIHVRRKWQSINFRQCVYDYNCIFSSAQSTHKLHFQVLNCYQPGPHHPSWLHNVAGGNKFT